jgi:hypothetical protein
VFRTAVSAGSDAGGFDVVDVNRTVRAIISLGWTVCGGIGSRVSTNPRSWPIATRGLAQRMVGVKVPD